MDNLMDMAIEELEALNVGDKPSPPITLPQVEAANKELETLDRGEPSSAPNGVLMAKKFDQPRTGGLLNPNVFSWNDIMHSRVYTFYVGEAGEIFHMHQSAAHKSPILRAAIYDARCEGHVCLRPVPANAFSDVAYWLYTGELPQPAQPNGMPTDALPYIRLHFLAEQLHLIHMETPLLKIVRELLVGKRITVLFLTDLAAEVYEKSAPDSLLRRLVIRMIAFRIMRHGREFDAFKSCSTINGFMDDLLKALSPAARRDKFTLDPCAHGHWIRPRKVEPVESIEVMIERGFISFS